MISSFLFDRICCSVFDMDGYVFVNVYDVGECISIPIGCVYAYITIIDVCTEITCSCPI
jgi:hypothetical protein